MRSLTKRDLLIIVLALAVVPAILVLRAWKTKGALKGQEAVEPFRIAGNFYYVGANDISAFLIAGPDGHVLLGAGGYATTAAMIIGSIEKLGFAIKDVKMLLSSGSDVGVGGGLSVLQQATGGALWASEWNARVIESGGDNPDLALPLRTLQGIGILKYQPARVDHRFKDGQTITLGLIAITAHETPGSSRSCTSWSFPVRDGDRVLNVVSACGLQRFFGGRYEGQEADLERSIELLRRLPVDIWVTGHARAWGRYRKFASSKTAKDPVEPFIDPEGYQAFIAAGEDELRRNAVH